MKTEVPSKPPAWLDDEAAQRTLQARADRAAAAFREAGLLDRLRRELEASKLGGTKVYRIGNSLRALSDELSALAVAAHLGAAVEDSTWTLVRESYLSVLLPLKRVAFHRPSWRADLWTADIGMNLAVALHVRCPALDRAAVERFVRERCLAEVLHDWVDPATRPHSLDTMGHNWWSVIVGGAGCMAAVLGDKDAAERIADNLRAWAAYPGNPVSRKQSNIGPDGDYVEGFSYGQYALLNMFAFSYFYPSFQFVPDVIDMERACGMAAWLKHAFVETDATSGCSADSGGSGGWHPQRFGDVKFYDYRPRAELWHALAATVDDPDLLDLAHRICPQPTSAMELLLWRPRPPRKVSQREPEPALRLFSRSGLAVMRRGGQRVTVRAGEFWNHNHLDSGTFIYHEDRTVWLDDCGVCAYSLPEYMGHYVTPAAHNVAFAPALVPPIRRAFLESTPHIGRYLAHAADDAVSVVCVDTNILSGGALMRSYRWFIDLAGEGFVVWDDLSGHTEQAYESRLHTMCAVERTAGGVTLRQGDQTRAVHFFSDLPTELTVEPAKMGEEDFDGAHRMGHAVVWRTKPGLRGKLGFAIGGGLRRVAWSTLESADASGASHAAQSWRCDAEGASGARWSIWFNPQADGRAMHANCVTPWDNLTTDAYALIRRESGGRVETWAVEGSFVRSREQVLFCDLTRSTLRKA